MWFRVVRRWVGYTGNMLLPSQVMMIFQTIYHTQRWNDGIYSTITDECMNIRHRIQWNETASAVYFVLIGVEVMRPGEVLLLLKWDVKFIFSNNRYRFKDHGEGREGTQNEKGFGHSCFCLIPLCSSEKKSQNRVLAIQSQKFPIWL